MSSPHVFVNDRPQNYNYLRDHLLAIPVAPCHRRRNR